MCADVSGCRGTRGRVRSGCDVGVANIRTMGEQLGATHLIEGSVRKAGNRVRITAQLIKADDGTHVWAENYDRELADVFAVQEEIATSIASALNMQLGLAPNDPKPSDFLLPVTGDTLGSATVARHAGNTKAVVITLDVGPFSFSPNGTFDATKTTAGSPSGLGLKPTMFGLEYSYNWFDSLPEIAQSHRFFNETAVRLARP